MDTKGNVIFLGSFSKIFMPGLRIGWMVAHHDILEKAVMLKQTVDLQSSSFAQRQASYYIDMYDLDAHVAALEQAAIQANCETRLLAGQQAQAFTAAALPLCRQV